MKEAQRMSILESEWASHEARREAELASATARLSTLEDRLQKVRLSASFIRTESVGHESAERRIAIAVPA